MGSSALLPFIIGLFIGGCIVELGALVVLHIRQALGATARQFLLIGPLLLHFAACKSTTVLQSAIALAHPYYPYIYISPGIASFRFG
jgi:hypothetical protein